MMTTQVVTYSLSESKRSHESGQGGRGSGGEMLVVNFRQAMQFKFERTEGRGAELHRPCA